MSRLAARPIQARLGAWLRNVVIPMSLLMSSVAYGQEVKTVALRAVDPNLNEALIRYIARNAVPTDLTRQPLSGIAPLTPRKIIERHCGKLTSAYWDIYWDEFQVANRRTDLFADNPISDPSDVAWPACLPVDIVPQPVRVGAGQTASNIYLQLTGSPGSEKTWPAFFGVPSSEELKSLQVGQVLTGKYRTLVREITPKGTRPGEFLAALLKIEAAAGKDPGAMFISLAPQVGKIVVAVSSDQVAAADDPSKCAAFADSPIGAGAVVMHAYENSWRNRKRKGGTAQIVIVDNGFFGADPTDISRDKGLFDGSPFPPNYFVRSRGNDDSLAQSIAMEREAVDPINYVHSLAPSDDTLIHGTHVTGLTLGGPAYEAHRDTVRGPDDPWAKITMLNVGRGGSGLIGGAQSHIHSFLNLNANAPLIVNMSIAYDAGADADVRTLFGAMRSGLNASSLLVVAAGNETSNVVALVPASLGGMLNDNVITVAAHDADGGLAPFSNFDADRVDIAAPGCKIESWTQNSKTKKAALSGTSMATPMVTFAAALLRSLDTDAKGKAIKNRLIASGDLLRQDDMRPIAYGGVRLNVAKALYWFDDYVKTEAGEFLGTIDRLPASARKCRGSAVSRGRDEIWSLKKRADGSGRLFLGKIDERVVSPCEVEASSATVGELLFTQSHRITPAGILPEPKDHAIPMKDVTEIVFRAR